VTRKGVATAVSEAGDTMWALQEQAQARQRDKEPEGLYGLHFLWPGAAGHLPESLPAGSLAVHREGVHLCLRLSLAITCPAPLSLSTASLGSGAFPLQVLGVAHFHCKFGVQRSNRTTSGKELVLMLATDSRLSRRNKDGEWCSIETTGRKELVWMRATDSCSSRCSKFGVRRSIRRSR
jgi:hypothetical protein